MNLCAAVVSLALVTTNLAAQDIVPPCDTEKYILPPRDTAKHISPPRVRAVFDVSVFGNVVARPSVAVTEEDEVLVRVVANNTLAKGISVHRISAARRLGELRIIDGSQVMGVKAAAGILGELKACYVSAVLGDFEAGLGEVEIRYVVMDQDKMKHLTLGSFNFNVEPLYAGMFSLGPVITDLPEPKFSVATNSAGRSYISVAESGNDRILYALIYTPFIRGKRLGEPALRWELESWWHRINPMFGVVLNDISRNALGGVSVDFPFGIVAHAGWHMGRTSEIDPESGLAAGSAIASDGTIPVIRRWNTGTFFGLTLDARVALKLIGLAGKTTLP